MRSFHRVRSSTLHTFVVSTGQAIIISHSVTAGTYTSFPSTRSLHPLKEYKYLRRLKQ